MAEEKCPFPLCTFVAENDDQKREHIRTEHLADLPQSFDELQAMHEAPLRQGLPLVQTSRHVVRREHTIPKAS